VSDSISPFIEIVQTGTSASGKTKVWEVRNISKGTNENDVPGWIRWHGAWRGYVYECEASFYDSKCLRQIADFIGTANKEHRAK
jgi:hypothetical protein